jgi:sugar O-acyltransferase (sialic acid O-acetyltransferase NeuD family)
MGKHMKKLMILGAGGFARRLISLLDMQLYDEIVLLDNYSKESRVMGYPVIDKLDNYVKYSPDEYDAFVAVTENRTRADVLFSLRQMKFKIPTIVHPRAYVDKNSKLGEGIFVNAGAIIEAFTELGHGCYIDLGAIVSHDSVLEHCVNLCPNAAIAGGVHLKACSFLGISASVIPHLIIGENTVIAAGAVVTKNIPANVMAAGVPAVIKKNYEVHSETLPV